MDAGRKVLISMFNLASHIRELKKFLDFSDDGTKIDLF